MIILSHPNGNRNVRSVLDALYQADLLQTYFTTVGLAQDDWILSAVPSKLEQQMRRRAYELPAQLIKRYPLRELTRLMAPKLKLGSIAKSPHGWASIESVYTALDGTVAAQIPRLLQKSAGGKKGLQGVYCYQDGALATFRTARQHGLKCFYDLPTAHCDTVERLLGEEVERRPEWQFSLRSSMSSPEKLERHRQEIAGADAIYVPSRFVYDSMPEEIRQTKEVCIAEFGSPVSNSAPAARDEKRKGPLRVLFAGGMGQRKGLGDVFEAMKLLQRDDVELVVMGALMAPLETYRAIFPGFIYEGPRPHSEVLKLMASCDVFVLPSLIEGRALVQQEALSQGLPLIVTKNAGAEDVIEEGKTGFLVPIRSPEAIAEKINWFADHRELLPEMRELSRAKAAEYTWQRYGKIIVSSITNKTGG